MMITETMKNDIVSNLVEYVGTDGMEVYLLETGEVGVRASGSFGEEKTIFGIITDSWYWNDSLANDELEINSDEEELRLFFEEVISNELETIANEI